MIDIFIGSIIFSVWCVTLFFGKSLGLSMLLFVIPITFFLLYILEKRNKNVNSKGKLLMIPIILLSSTYFIFNNSFFNTVNIFMIPILIVYMILILLEKDIKLNFNFISSITGIVFTPISLISETFTELKEMLKEKLNIKKISSKQNEIKNIVKAVCITIPVILLIIWLLSSADEAFGNIFNQMLRSITNGISKIQFSTVTIKLILMTCAFLYFISFFNYITSKYEKNDIQETNNKEIKDNFTIKMILGALNVVYLVFCVIQIKSIINQEGEIVYSYYARKGFFQLMIVSLINLFTILIAKRNDNKEGEKNNRYIDIMCLMMIVFTFIILISAVVRMYFYESAYGYTFLRLLVYSILFTESVLLIPTILYVLDKKIDLSKTYFVIILIIYVGMNFANFDNLIAKRNVDRYISLGKIDIDYLRNNTGTDAVREIIRFLENDMEDDMRLEARVLLKNVYDELNNEDMDFRSINLSKVFAKSMIEESKYLEGLDEIIQERYNSGKNLYDNKYYYEDKDNNIYTPFLNKDEVNNYKEEEVLYQVSFQNGVKFKIINKGSWSGKDIIQILKSGDGGITWKSQIDNEEGAMDVHYGTKFVFLDENIGFINDSGIINSSRENEAFMVTNDGGKTFCESVINLPEYVVGDLFLEDVPYMENGKLKLKLYNSFGGTRYYYEFISKDKGKSWNGI